MHAPLLKTNLSAFSFMKICWFARSVGSLQPRMLHPYKSRQLFPVAEYASLISKFALWLCIDGQS